MMLRRSIGFLAASAFALTACATDSSTDIQSNAESGKKPVVLTSFYPIQYLTERIGSDLITVESITPPGADAHHVELSPAKVNALGSAEVVIYAKGFQNAIDEAIEANPAQNVVDIAPMVQLLPVIDTDDDHGQSDEEHDHDHADERHDHAQSEDDHDHEHDHDGLDPHFWLDPQRMANASTAIGQALAKAFPQHAQVFTQNAAAVAKDMNDLSSKLVTATQTCKQDSFVTAHQAFGYLAERGGLKQIGMSDVDPEAAPSPARLKEVSAFIKEHGIKTVFSEELLDPKVAQTLADDLGLKVAVLDPLESQADPSKDYIAVMESNIQTLHDALDCQ